MSLALDKQTQELDKKIQEPVKSYQKLVRDNIINIIADEGEIARYYVARGNILYKEASKKLDEEMLELFDAASSGDKNNIMEEIGDVQDVISLIESFKEVDFDLSQTISASRQKINSIMTDYDLSPNDVENIRIAKNKLKGGFKKGIILESKKHK